MIHVCFSTFSSFRSSEWPFSHFTDFPLNGLSIWKSPVPFPEFFPKSISQKRTRSAPSKFHYSRLLIQRISELLEINQCKSLCGCWTNGVYAAPWRLEIIIAIIILYFNAGLNLLFMETTCRPTRHFISKSLIQTKFKNRK